MDAPDTLPVDDAWHHATYDAMSVVILRGELLRRLVGRDELDAEAIRDAVAHLQVSVQTLALALVGREVSALPDATPAPGPSIALSAPSG